MVEILVLVQLVVAFFHIVIQAIMIKGTLTRDILAFFIIFNIKSVCFSVCLRFLIFLCLVILIFKF